MNKNKISKIIVLIITFALIACLSTTVFAEDPVDLSNSLSGGNNTTGNGTTGNNTTVDNTTENQVPDITPNTTTPTNTNTNSNTTTNSSNNSSNKEIIYDPKWVQATFEVENIGITLD